jgi:hypothetical protein
MKKILFTSVVLVLFACNNGGNEEGPPERSPGDSDTAIVCMDSLQYKVLITMLPNETLIESAPILVPGRCD